MSERVAVVTGAGRGIGAATAVSLREKGFSIVAVDRSEEVEQVAARVGGRALRCDVADPASVAALAESVESADVLVNNAGVWEFGPLDGVTPESFRRVVDVNVLGTLQVTQAFAKHLEATRGCVVNMTSMLAEHPMGGTGIYPATKAAIVALTKQFALEYSTRGIRVNAVAPGMIRTPGMTGAFGDTVEEEQRRGSYLPLGRLGEPEDVAEVVAFLASDAARYMTGQVLHTDGGVGVGTLRFLLRAFTGS